MSPVRPQYVHQVIPPRPPLPYLAPRTYNSNNQVLPSTEIEQAKSAAVVALTYREA